MPYIGKSPLHGNYSKLDDFSGDFDGSDATHALATNGISITPVTEAAVLISINGVLQEPVTDYTVSGTNITFTTAPASGASFFGVALGEQLAGNTPSNSTITSAKLAGTFLTGATDIGAAIVDADLLLVDDGAGGTLRKTAASRLKTYIGGNDPSSADGQALGSTSLEWSDLYLADGGAIYFGNDQDVFAFHVHNLGLSLKNTSTGDDTPFVLTLQTGETDIAADDVLGRIQFQAPDEGTGTDAVAISAAIQAISEGDFAADANATALGFLTGVSGTATTKMSLSSGGNLDVTGDITGSTINADGDTAAGDLAAMGYTSVLGAILTGQGSTNDVTLVNDADATVLGIPTGTTNVTIAGDVTMTGTTPTLTIGDAGAEDTAIVFDGNAQDFHIGLDDTADDLVIGLGSALGTTTHMAFTEDGEITKPLQPAFAARPTDATTQADMAVASAVEIVFGTERFDQGGDFASNTFTAPVTGKYYLSAAVTLTNMDTASSSYQLSILTSNQRYYWYMDPNFSADLNLPMSGSVVADMDSGDTAVVQIWQGSGTAQTDITVAATWFSGCLLAQKYYIRSYNNGYYSYS